VGLPPKKKRKSKSLHLPEAGPEPDLPPLGQEQTEALKEIQAFLKDPVKELFLLEGYAGTGKSTLCRHLIHGLVGIQVALAAPTNKAVGVLRDITWDLPVKVPAGTLHHWLNLALIENREGETHLENMGEHRLAKVGLLIVDECSMIDEALWQSLQDLFEGRPKLKVLLMGDPAQLPPVGEELSHSFQLADGVSLKEVFRQGKGHPILSYSMKLRDSMLAKAIELPLPEASEEKMVLHQDEGLFRGEMMKAFSEAESDGRCSDLRVLAYTNARVERWNQMVQSHLFGKIEAPFDPRETLILKSPLGAKRMDGRWYRILSTDDEVRLVGSRALDWEGVPCYELDVRGPDGRTHGLTYVDNRHREAWELAKKEKRKHCSEHPFEWPAFDRFMASVVPLQSAFAMTVHRCQGSTFERVFIDLPSFGACRDWPMKLRLLYVAISRSRSRVDIYWPKE
jgi:ATP-dependent exoDNAse (exonuclease V) alpha subunit